MKKIIIVFLVLIFITNIRAEESGLKLPGMIFEPVFEVGGLNGRPMNIDSPLVKNEFSILSAEERTVQVKNKKDFPQRLNPGQRIALFLKEVPKDILLLKLAVAANIRRGETNPPAISIFFNDKPIWSHVLHIKNSIISAVIPAAYIEKGSNVLQIRNSGINPVCFDWLCLSEYNPEKPVYLMIDNLDEMQYPGKREFNMSVIEINIKGNGCGDTLSFSVPAYYPLPKIPSVAERGKNLEKFRKLFNSPLSEKTVDNKLLTRLWKRISSCLKMGMEPVVRIKGTSSEQQIKAISSACCGTVYFWIVESRKANQIKASLTIIRKIIPESKIYVNGFSNFPEVVFRSGAFASHKELSALSFYGKDFRSGKLRIADRTINISPHDRIPDEICGEWYYNDTRTDLNFQKKYMEKIPLDVSEWLWSGGTSIILQKVLAGRRFFDPVTHKPTLPFYALKRVSPLFEGKPVKLHCNVIPIVKNNVLYETYWTAVKNAEGVVTILIAAHPGITSEVKLICPVPFSGESSCEITTGFVRKNKKNELQYQGVAKLKTERSIVNIPISKKKGFSQGLFEHKLYLSNCTIIRLTKKGATMPERPKFFSRKTKNRPEFKKGILKVTYNHPPPDAVRTIIRYPNGVIHTHSVNYKGKTKISATRGRVGNTENVVPWHKTSEFVEISYPNGKASDTEGASLSFSGGPKNCDMMCFWVYPRSVNPLKKVTLRFYLFSKGKPWFFAVDLKTGRWQRVIFPCDKIPPPYWDKICIVGDPKAPEYKKGNKITFEFNGFYVLGSKHRRKGESRLTTSRIIEGNNSRSIILLGRPKKYFEYRYAFPEPVKFKKVSALSKIKDIELTWHQDAQVLEIKGIFPEKDYKPSERLLKVLTSQENKSLEAGKTVSVGIKLLYEK